MGLGDVEVDVAEFVTMAKLVVQERCWLTDWAETAEMLRNDLLPGWYEDWVLSERDRLHQLGLHGLEKMSALLVSRGHYAAALEVALRAVAADPLRESAHRAVIVVHLAEGNLREARAQYETCQAILRAELGIGPSPVCKELFGRAEVPMIAARPAEQQKRRAAAAGAFGPTGDRRPLQPRSR
jgi:DNA-binding SARP family transcriptional activator